MFSVLKSMKSLLTPVVHFQYYMIPKEVFLKKWSADIKTI